MKPSTEELLRLAERYKTEPTRDIAAEFGIAPATLRSWFSDMGISKNDVSASQIRVSSKPRYDKPPKIATDCLVLSDSHIPYHDAKFINNCVELAKSWGVTNLCLPGDTFDMASISVFRVRPEATLKQELSDGQKFLVAMSTVFDDILLLPGNHERRLLHILNEQVEMVSLLNLLRADSKVRTSQYSYAFVGTNWLVGHPRNISMTAGKIPTALARIWPKYHVASGHGHLSGMVVMEDGDRIAVDIGTAADPKRFDWIAEHLSISPAMSQGALILKKLDDGRTWPYHLLPKMDWRAMARLYSNV